MWRFYLHVEGRLGESPIDVLDDGKHFFNSQTTRIWTSLQIFQPSSMPTSSCTQRCRGSAEGSPSCYRAKAGWHSGTLETHQFYHGIHWDKQPFSLTQIQTMSRFWLALGAGELEEQTQGERAIPTRCPQDHSLLACEATALSRRVIRITQGLTWWDISRFSLGCLQVLVARWKQLQWKDLWGELFASAEHWGHEKCFQVKGYLQFYIVLECCSKWLCS